MKSNEKSPKFISIRKQLVLIILGFMVSLLAFIWIINALLLPNVLRRVKISAMEKVFNVLDEASVNGVLFGFDFENSFEQAAYNNNLDIVVVSHDGSILLSSGKAKRQTVQRLFDAILLNHDYEEVYVQTDEYAITLEEDDYVHEEYLVLTGTLADDNLVMMRYALENMNYAIRVFHQTHLIVALFAFALAFVLAELFSSRITQSIYKLTDISKKMADLDFGVRYQPRGTRTEIDTLGEHMNTMSDALEKSYAELKKANIELQKDIELKEKNEEMRTEFLSGVAHELKTPIALIQGYAEGLSEGMAEDPESRDYYCEVIVDEASKMNRLVAQLMSLNELEYNYNNKDNDKTQFCITELIRGIVESYRILIEQEGIRVEFNIDNDIEVNSSPELVEMALSNYISNAIHYCKNEKTIRITQLDKGDNVCVSVYNTGDTIPEDSIPRIWEKFYKVDKARTREYGGSGVGLSIVQLAINTLGGKYGVYNSEDGVTFWLEINK